MKSQPIGVQNILATDQNTRRDDARGGSFLLPHQQLGAIALPTNPTNGQTLTLTVNGTAVVITYVSTIGSTANNVLIQGSAALTAAATFTFLRHPNVTNANQVAATAANQQLLQYCGYSLPSGGTTITPFSLNKNLTGVPSNLTSFTVSTTVTGANWTAQTMQLYVEDGTYYVGATRVLFLGGSTPTFTAPVSNPRIDIVTADSSGSIAVVTGTEASSPVAPAYPANKVVICEVYNVVGETGIYDNENQQTGQGYVLNDVRPIVGKSGYISSTAQIASGLFLLDPGSEAQGDILYYNGSAWARLPAGTSGQALLTQGAGANPQWAIPQAFVMTTVGGGGPVLQDATTSRATSSVTPVKVKTFTCNVAGRYTFNCNLRTNNGSDAAEAYLYQNGVQVASQGTVQTSDTRLTFGDFQCAAGDVLDLYISATSPAATTTDSFQVLGQYGIQFVVGGTTYAFIPTLTEGNFGSVPAANWTVTTN